MSDVIWDIVDNVREADDKEIIALHKMRNSLGDEKMCVILQGEKNIIGIDIFYENGTFEWEVKKTKRKTKKEIVET